MQVSALHSDIVPNYEATIAPAFWEFRRSRNPESMHAHIEPQSSDAQTNEHEPTPEDQTVQRDDCVRIALRRDGNPPLVLRGLSVLQGKKTVVTQSGHLTAHAGLFRSVDGRLAFSVLLDPADDLAARPASEAQFVSCDSDVRSVLERTKRNFTLTAARTSVQHIELALTDLSSQRLLLSQAPDRTALTN